jgi:hypothetical protein
LEAIFISSGQWTISYRFALLARLEELHSASGLVPYFAFWMRSEDSFRWLQKMSIEELHSASGLVPYFAFWDAKRG